MNRVAPRDGCHCEERLITRYRVCGLVMNRTHSSDTWAAHSCQPLSTTSRYPLGQVYGFPRFSS